MTAYERILAQPRDLLRWPDAPDGGAQFAKHVLAVDAWGRVIIAGAYGYEPVAPFPTATEAQHARDEANRIWWAFIDRWAEHDHRSV